MGLILNTYHDYIKYTLRKKGEAEVVISEPKGWEDDSKEILRDRKTHGKRRKFSSKLEFFDVNVAGYTNSFDFILDSYKLDGINAEVVLAKYVQDPFDTTGNKKVIEYEMTLDYSTMKIMDDKEGKRINIQSNDEGIGQIIMSRIKEPIEIERLTTFGGKTLPPLNFETVATDGKKIFLDSKLQTSISALAVNLQEGGSGNTQAVGSSFPVKIEFQSDTDVNEPFTDQFHMGYFANMGIGQGEASSLFFVNSQEKTRSIRIITDLTFNLFATLVSGKSLIERVRVDLVVYKDVSDDSATTPTAFKNRITLFENLNPTVNNGKLYKVNSDLLIDFEKNDGIALLLYSEVNFYTISPSTQVIRALNSSSSLRVQEDSFEEKTQTKCVLPFELGERLTQITSNQKDDVFRSKILGRTDLGYASDGFGSLAGLTTGLLIRGFENTDFTGVDNKDKRFTTTLKDYLDTFINLFNCGWSIEKRGFDEYLRVEEMKYFYQDTVTIVLPNQVSKIKRTVAKEEFFSSVEVGNKKVFETDEVFGLDEPNTKTNYVTQITRVDNKLQLIHPYNTSIYAKEFARRKPKSTFPTEDTKYDNINFILDLKRGGADVFEQRKWQDDFDVEPTGIFDPDTATELRFSPANTLMRNGWLLSTGLQQYPNGVLNNTGSVRNSNLTTKLTGKPTIKESEDIINNTLGRSKFIGEIIEFEHEVTSKIMLQVEGTTFLANGDEIDNFYGQVEFINENNQKEYGYLLNLKPNKEGKWKVLKANKF